MSEGQQRTVALALKLAATEVLHVQDGVSPLLLIDDVFGELDRERRGAFLASLPANSQKLVTTTFLDWVAPEVAGARLDLGPQSGE
jgi:DNA replication and repair protein RecF